MFVGKTYIPISNSTTFSGGSCVRPEGLEAVFSWIMCVGLVGTCLVGGCAFTRLLTQEHGWIGFLLGVLLTMFMVGLSCMPIVACLL